MQKPESCKSCPLYNRSFSFSKPEGTARSGVAIVGEALGREEGIDGLPFRPYAQSGSLLEEVIRKHLGMKREDFLLWNIVACNPPGNLLEGAWYENEAIEHCGKYFRRIVWDNPGIRCIVALGNLCTRVLTQLSGPKLTISHVRGFVLPSSSVPVVPSYHPSFIRRGNAPFTEYLIQDIRTALDVAGGKHTGYKGGEGYEEPDYCCFPSEGDARSFLERIREGQRRLVTFDIEGPKLSGMEEDEKEGWEGYEVSHIQFSGTEGFGISFPWREPYIGIAREILGTPNPKLGVNSWLFDGQVLRDKGIETRGVHHDLMWMFKMHHPELERGLQKVASLFRFPFNWKHLSEKMIEWYGCADVDAPQRIVRKLKPLMEERGTWGCYVREMLELRPILEGAERRGIPVSEEKRGELKRLLEVEREKRNASIQEAIPGEVRAIKVWKKGPKGLTKFINKYREAQEAARRDGRELRSLEDNIFRNFKFTINGETKTGLRFGKVVEETDGGERKEVEGWIYQKEFNPASSEQLKEYIRWKEREEIRQGVPRHKRKYKMPRVMRKDAKTKEKVEKETTGKDELERLAGITGDPVFKAIIELRSIGKMLNNDLPNWEPWKDGKVHTTFGFSPPTGQLNSRRPNVQNCAKHTGIGQRFRGIIEAEEGREFIEFDFSGFHVLTMAREAEDERYMFFGLHDIHSFFTSYLVRDKGERPIPLDIRDEGELDELTRYFREKYPEIRQKRAKETVLANQLGQGARGLYMRHRHRGVFRDVKDAQWHQDLLNDLFSKVARTKERMRRQAHENGYLQNAFGRIQYFYEVYRWDSKSRSLKHGMDSERAIAFLVQSNAFGMLFEKLREIEARGWNEKYSFVDTIHDSLIYYPWRKDREECIENVTGILKGPCKRLAAGICPDGLRAKVGIEVGRNWKKWNEGENKDGMREVKN